MAIAPYGYAHEKLVGAMDIMVTGKGSRRQRLARAGRDYLFRLSNPRQHRLPSDLADSLASLLAELTSTRPQTRWDDTFEATARNMSWQKAERLAQQLFSLFLAVVELRRQAAAKLDYERQTC
ncbi:hypothetical protein Q9K02_01690 [Qipengyuania sp. G39]|uniref:Uncharacterized protein n=1 Tax=Qipengyuania profundimaris TaxID=3067652 RepID=A0ABT9HL23_9SPHN|nr:hypothetical protein [Qipengyuania sp. G39]MDP4573849.1 hypothetical protein [Qipengyuania sp. G39]